MLCQVRQSLETLGKAADSKFQTKIIPYDIFMSIYSILKGNYEGIISKNVSILGTFNHRGDLLNQ